MIFRLFGFTEFHKPVRTLFHFIQLFLCLSKGANLHTTTVIFYFIAIIQTGMMISGKPSCLWTARTSRPAMATMLLMMSRWRLMLLSMGSSLQPCLAILSFIIMTPFGRRLFLQRIRKFIRSLSVRWPGEEVTSETEVCAGIFVAPTKDDHTFGCSRDDMWYEMSLVLTCHPLHPNDVILVFWRCELLQVVAVVGLDAVGVIAQVLLMRMQQEVLHHVYQL